MFKQQSLEMKELKKQLMMERKRHSKNENQETDRRKYKKMAKDSKKRVERANYKSIEIKENDLQYERDRLKAYMMHKRKIEASLITEDEEGTSSILFNAPSSLLESSLSLPSILLTDGGKGISRTNKFHIPISNPIIKTPRRLAIPLKKGPSQMQLNRASQMLGGPNDNRTSAIHQQANAIEQRVNAHQFDSTSKYTKNRNVGHLFEMTTSSSSPILRSNNNKNQRQNNENYGFEDMMENSRATTPTAEEAAKALVIMQTEEERKATNYAKKYPHKWNPKNIKKKIWERDNVPMGNKEEWMQR